MAPIFTSLLLLVSVSTSAFGLELQKKKNPQTVKFRIAAVTEGVRKSGVSPNRETYLAYLIDSDKSYKSVKLVFRHLGYEDGLSADFADFALVHTFKALRERSCDETYESFSTKLVVGPAGKLQSVAVARYVSPDAAQDIPADQVLPCYVINPQGYKGSKADAVGHVNSSTVQSFR